MEIRPRMLCADCGALAHADTLLGGSDRLEILGWLCLALPGWLYCAWRHALRAKVCPACGSPELLREAWAAALRSPVATSPTASSLRNVRGPVRWPGALRWPRVRLRLGGGVLVGWTAVLAVSGLAASGRIPSAAGLALAAGIAVAGGGWVAREARRIERSQAAPRACRAWDGRGRPLRIELV